MRQRKQFPIFLMGVCVLCMMLSACRRQKEETVAATEQYEGTADATDEADVIEKGYGLPIDKAEEEEARADCEAVMNSVKAIYQAADKGDSSNVTISDQVMEQMQDVIKNFGNPVPHGAKYSELYNYEKMEAFLKAAENGEQGELVYYEVTGNGSIGRTKFSSDGKHLYALCTNTAWTADNRPTVTIHSFFRIKEWEYTEKGWFIFEYCMPEPPEVTEIMTGSDMIRVKPFREQYLRIAKEYLMPVGYQRNNLFCTDWDEEHMAGLDYNALYQSLYEIRYQRPFDWSSQEKQIPGEEFEALMTQCLPVTAEEVRSYAVYDEVSRTYSWLPLGCGNYSPHHFGGSLPEVTAMTENPDGTALITVDAVCPEVGEAYISHQVLVRFGEDGQIRFLGNHILGNGASLIPPYQYRAGRPD